MTTKIRPELSKKSKYYISKHRYYELKHFVQQYPEWVDEIKFIDSMVRASKDGIKLNNIPDPVGKAVERRVQYTKNIYICDEVAKETDPVLGEYILRSIIAGDSYSKIKARLGIPCSKDMYYDRYHKFFWLLDKARK